MANTCTKLIYGTKKWFSLLFLVLLSISSHAQNNYTWLGEVSPDWNNPLNWNPAAVPGNNATIHINDDGVNFPCVLNSDRTINTLNLSVGILNLGGFTLTASNAHLIGGVLQNGTLTAINISSLSNANLFNVTIRKTAGSNNDWSGNNNFNDFTFINQSIRRVRMAVNQGDTFHGNTTISKNNSGQISVACAGLNIFNGHLTISNTHNGNFNFGDLGGSVVINNGALLTNGFNVGVLNLINFTQNHVEQNGAFTPATFTANNVQLRGDIQINASTINITSSAFLGNNSFSAGSINLNNANELGSAYTQTVLTKTGTGTNTWQGGNVFYNFTFNNNNSGATNFANTVGDRFYGTTEINRNGSGTITLARTDTSRFFGNLTINSSASGSLTLSTINGAIVIEEGFALLSNTFTNGNLLMQNLVQRGSADNDVLSPVNLTMNHCEFGGRFSVNTIGTLTMNNCNNKNANTLSAANLYLSGNRLSYEEGEIIIYKNGNTNNDWVGGNVFGNLTLNNNSTARIMLAVSSGDTFLGNTRFNKNSTGNIHIARTGENFFNGNIILNSSSTGAITIGENGGTSVLNNGAFLTEGFSGASLTINRLTQTHEIANGVFTPLNFTSLLTTLKGSFEVYATGTITLNQVNFASSNRIEGGRVILQNNNSLSNISGNTVIAKNATSDDIWTGGNQFGQLTINNNSNSTIRLANVNGDIFTGELIINKNSSGTISVAAAGENIFQAHITLNSNTPGLIRFGELGGTSLLTGNTRLKTDGFDQTNLILNGITQETTQANDHFLTGDFTAINTILRGATHITASGSIILTNSSFIGNTVFIAPNITLNGSGEFATAEGAQITVTKIGGTLNSWNGGNTFGTLVINQNSNSGIRLGNNIGDTFTKNVTIFKNANGDVGLAHNGTNIFQGDIILNTTNLGNIRIGEANGVSTQFEGFSIKTSNFTQCNLLINRFVQLGNQANGNFNPLHFTSNNSVFNGDVHINAVGNITLNNTSMTANALLIGNNIYLNASGSFATSNNASLNITKTGGVDNFWHGGNVFGNFTLTNLSNNGIRLANSVGDTYEGNVQFTCLSTGIIRAAHNGTNHFKGNISTAGSIQNLTLGAGNGNINISGNADQQILGDAGQTLFVSRLIMNSNAALNLNIPLHISVNLSLNNGHIRSSQANLLVIQNNATCTGGANASHVIGPVRKIGNQSFSFPVGNGEIFKPIGISAPSNNTHHFTAEFFYDNSGFYYPHSEKSPTLHNISTCGYWILDRTNGNSAVSVTLNHGRAACAVYDPSTLRVARWNGSSWSDHGQGSYNAMDVVSNGPISSFSPFAVSYEFQEPLPVEMLDYRTQVLHDVVMVKWKTASETNSHYFDVERSRDLSHFEKVATHQAAYHSNKPTDYEVIDREPLAGVSYYRIVQVDMDGKTAIFGPMMVNLPSQAADWIIYPNPCQSLLTISFQNMDSLQAVQLTDLQGNLIRNFTQIDSTRSSLELDLQGVAKGIYFISIRSNKGIQYKRIVKY
ncbi:MAG: T9SS type A sorting domain-containing protein [Flavobacteriales bacterium]